MPTLAHRFPNKWYKRIIDKINFLVEKRGQEVKHISRSLVVTNQYNDIVYSESDVKTIRALIIREPSMAVFLGAPFGQYEDMGEVEISAYFASYSNVKADDLIVVEQVSLEGVFDRDVYVVLPPKSFYYEAEVARKFVLSPLRDRKLVLKYSSTELDSVQKSIDGERPGTPEFYKTDIFSSPGSFYLEPSPRVIPARCDPDRVPNEHVDSRKSFPKVLRGSGVDSHTEKKFKPIMYVEDDPFLPEDIDPFERK